MVKEMEKEIVNSLSLAIEVLESFLVEHQNWRFARNEANRLAGQLEDVLAGFEGLIEEMDAIWVEEKAGKA